MSETLPAVKNIRVIVCGGRTFSSSVELYFHLDIIDQETPIDVVIHGGAQGADTLAGEWAARRGKATRVVFPDWDKHGRAAGPIRNQKMIDDHAPDLVIAFAGGIGTADMVKRAKKAGIPVTEIP